MTSHVLDLIRPRHAQFGIPPTWASWLFPVAMGGFAVSVAQLIVGPF